MSESLCKGSYLSHIRLVLPYLIEIPSMLLQSKIGACGVLLLGLPISNRDITARGYPVISGWGLIRSPFAHSKRGKLYSPGKSGLCLSGFKSAPGKFRVLAGRFCVLVTSDKKQNGSRTAHFYAFPICGDALVYCCQSAIYPIPLNLCAHFIHKSIDMRTKKEYNI